MPITRQTLDFLFENRMHDSREWFNEHKTEYRALVVEPMRELVQALTETMLQIDGKFTTEPQVDKTISRIWRDTRFSHDPSLYRDNMWIIFRRGKMHGTDFPSMYFEFSAGGFSYGSGFYHASTGFMNTLRQMVLSGDPFYQRAQKALSSQSVFRLDGECFKRPRYPDLPEEERNWLERRGISANAYSRDFALLFSDRLADKLIADYRLLAPIYDLLLETARREAAGTAGKAALQRVSHPPRGEGEPENYRKMSHKDR